MNHKSFLKLLCLFFAGLMAWMFPEPVGLNAQGWHLFIIFILTIVCIILNPIPMSVTALLGGLTCVLTKTLTLADVLNGFGSTIVWVVVLAFFIARGFIKTGLGKRIAYMFISKLEHTTLGLGYGLVATEFLLSPMIPSVTARSGGIIYPIAKSIIDAYGEGKSAEDVRSTGTFLLKLCFQANVITSAMFVTAMAANPLIIIMASKLGAEITWSSWAIGAIVPGLCSLLLLPLILYFLCRPGIKESSKGPELAREMLASMGPLSRNEKIMLFVFIFMIIFWILDARIGLDTTTSALIGVITLILTGVITWDDAISEKNAWDTMVWFAILLGLSGLLAKFGVMEFIGSRITSRIGSDMSNVSVLIISVLIYTYIHYFFASVTARITAFYSIFTIILWHNAGLSLFVASLITAYSSSLAASLTHYGNSSAPIFYGSKYIPIGLWWRVGFIVSICNLAIWGGVGYLWWSLLGWV